MSNLTGLLRNQISSRLIAGHLKRNNYFTYSASLTQPLDRKPKIVNANEALSVLESGEIEIEKFLH